MAIAAEHVSGYARVASAHADAAYLQMREYENRAFRAPVATVKRAVTAYPYETAFGSLVASALVLPAPRRALFRLALGARSSEEAIFKRASRGSEAAKDSANAAEKELKVLRNAAVAAGNRDAPGGAAAGARWAQKLKSASTRAPPPSRTRSSEALPRRRRSPRARTQRSPRRRSKRCARCGRSAGRRMAADLGVHKSIIREMPIPSIGTLSTRRTHRSHIRTTPKSDDAHTSR